MDDDELDHFAVETDNRLEEPEEQILKAEAHGPDDAAEIISVVIDMIEECFTVHGRDIALLRQARTVLTWPERPH